MAGKSNFNNLKGFYVQNDATLSKSGRISAASLRDLREKSGYSPRHICQILGLARRTWQDYESGRVRVPLKVSDALQGIIERDKIFMLGVASRVKEVEDRKGGLK